MGVDGEIGQRVAANGGQDAIGVLRDHLYVSVKQHPVARQRPIAVVQRMPALMCLRVLQDGNDAGRVGVGVHPGVGPVLQRPGVGRSARHPALPADDLGPKLKGHAGEGGAGLAVVRTVCAVLLPDQRFHLGRCFGLGQPQVVRGDAHDGRAQRRVIRLRRPGRLVERRQRDGDAGRRRDLIRGSGDEGEACNRPAGADADERRRLLPPRLTRGIHRVTFFHDSVGRAEPPEPCQAATGGASGDRQSQRLVCERFLRMACTCGLPGFPAFPKRIAASWASWAVAPTAHFW